MLRCPVRLIPFSRGPGSYHQATDLFYFSRSAQRYDKEKTVQLNSYVIKKSEINQNRIAIALPFNLEGSSTLHPSISPSGERLFFASDRPGGFGGMDLYYVTIKNGQYSEPINMGPDINTAGDGFSFRLQRHSAILFLQREGGHRAARYLLCRTQN